MNKRSKVSLVILVCFVFLVIASLNVNTNSSSLETDINEFEAEIINPNNDLSYKSEAHLPSSYLLVNFANEINGVIKKVFDVIINLVQSLCEGVF